MRIRGYECTVKDTGWVRVVHAESPGKAKAKYWRDVVDAYPDLPYTAIRILRTCPPTSGEDFQRVAEYRGVPYAKVGMKVLVDGDAGIITGSNSSANFNVLFTEGKFAGQELNCHPNWKMEFPEVSA